MQNAGYETALLEDGIWVRNHYISIIGRFSPTPQKNLILEFLMENGKKESKDMSTDIITDLAIQWLSKRKKINPISLWSSTMQHSTPWMPAIRHLNLYDDKILPEPENLETNYSGKASPAGTKK